MNREETSSDQTINSERQPYRMRLPGFIDDQEIGLGDVIKRFTSFIGIQPCDGCRQRAAMLNRWMAFTGRRKK